jgi:predicted RNase H-like nuclease (RuvC/YqgF family)
MSEQEPAPAALDLDTHVRELIAQVAELREETAQLRDETAALRTRAEEAEARLAAQDARSDELRSGLWEARRLNLRIAELTDVVTELVLPLHDRELDASVLQTLRPDTQ